MMWLRRSLTFKWLFTLLFTGLFGVGLVWFFANRTTNTGFDQLKLDQAQANFVTTVQAYYQAHSSWDGVLDALRSTLQSADGSFGPPQFILADASNKIVLAPLSLHAGDLLPTDQVGRGTPVLVNGKKVGTVVFAFGAPLLDPREQRYLDQTNQGLLIGAIGAALIAVLVGIILTRHFMRPLDDLTIAIRAMRQGQLEQQVPVRSLDELGELTQTFNQMSKDLAHANYLRRQMTADIAHDLRTPLTIISGYLEGLRDGTLRPTPERLETMASQVLRLKHLVEDLRTLSLADARELKLMLQPVPVDVLLNNVATSFRVLLDEKDLQVEVQVDPGLPPLNVDRERMTQVLGNLVTNALRHTPSGGTVVLSACADPKQIEISVHDTGEGIPRDKLPNIFERLYRVDDARSAGSDDSGLGLAIVKSIVEAHGATVSAQSEVDKGTTITIQFPVNDAAPQKMA